MNKITSRPSLLRGFSVLACVLVLIMTNAQLPVAGITQAQDRTVTKFRNGKLLMPLEIRKIKTKKRVVKAGEVISDDDDWFDGLTLTIENTSGKTIIYIGGGFFFFKPRVRGIAEPPWYHTFTYGRHPSAPSTVRLTNLPLTIKAGETFDITIAHSDYISIKQRLEEFKHPPSVKDIKFNVEEIYYDDGTAWIVGDNYERDPNNPEKYKRKDDQPERTSKKKEKSVTFVQASLRTRIKPTGAVGKKTDSIVNDVIAALLLIVM